MPRIKMKVTARREAFRWLGVEALDLRGDAGRRFRNAILCLVRSDPGWMIWVERTLPPRMEEIREDLEIWLTLVESAARWRVLAGYNYFHRCSISGMVFRRDWAFTDEGTLSPG